MNLSFLSLGGITTTELPSDDLAAVFETPVPRVWLHLPLSLALDAGASLRAVASGGEMWRAENKYSHHLASSSGNIQQVSFCKITFVTGNGVCFLAALKQ